MKTLLPLVTGSVIIGLGLGAALAFVEVLPAVAPSQIAANGQREVPHVKEQKFTKLPHAVVPETVFEFDRIERGTSMRHDFLIKNTGDGPLKVQFESNTCKCTGVELAGKLVKAGQGITVPPHEKADVTLKWAAKTEAGPFRHGANFSTNDPRNSRIELVVNGQVVESTSMNPSELLFGTIEAGDSKEASLYLMSMLEDEVTVLDYEVTPLNLTERLKVEISAAEKRELPQTEAISGLKVSVIVDSGSEIGPFRGWLSMTTNLRGAEKLLVPIMGTVKGDVSIYGPGWNPAKGLLRMGNISGAKGKQVRLNLAVRGEHAQTAKFELASVDPSELKVTLGEPHEIREQLLHVPILVEVPPRTRPLVRMGEPVSSDAVIVFKSNHPQAKEVHMRVHFAVSQ